ncbi:MAG: TonB-dependent siderophore receptor [Elusimicrobia bacterium]|nr:TonB-dependent siderophore receptor [Elusimicrobiota bacterium]
MKRNTKRGRQFFEIFVWRCRQWQSARGLHCRQWGRVVTAGTFGVAILSSAARKTWAQDDPAKLPEVVVTGERKSYKPEGPSSPKYTQPLRDIPQTVTIVPQAVIQEQGATTLRDVLRNVSGISIQAGEGGVPAGDNLSIRGFGARTDIFIDGVRDFGGYARDPFDFEQIEVVKGPASSYGGRGSTGGSVNMTTKMPRADAFRRGEISMGSADYKRVTADVNQPLSPLGWERSAFRLNLLWHDAAVPGRDVAHNSRWGAAPAFLFGLGSPTKLTVTYLHLDQYNQPDYGIPWVPETNTALVAYRGKAPPTDFSNYYGLIDRDFERTLTDVPTVILSHEFDGGSTLRNLTRYGRTYRESLITTPRFAANNSTNVTRELKGRDQTDTVLSNQIDLTLRFKTGSVDHALVTGLEVAREESNNTPRGGATGPVTSLSSPNPSSPYTFSILPSTFTFGKAETHGVYAFETMRFGEKWELSGGARWDKLGSSVRTIPVKGPETLLTRGDEMISGRAGLVFKPVPSGSLYAGYGTSFNPSAEGLTLANTATSVNSPNLDPEESRSYEVGTKWDLFGERLSVGAALFRTEKINARTEDPTSAADFVVLEGVQRVDGVEFNVAGSPMSRWSVFGGYTYMDGRVLSSKNATELGSPLANTPRHSANVWSTFRLPWDVEIGGGAQYVGARYSASTNTRRYAPGYSSFDAMVSKKVSKSLTLRFNAYNLANERYIDRLSGGHFIPGPGRWVQGTLSVEF